MSTEYIEGQALVASPFLMDRNFRHTVVYIIKHDEDGAYGLILNRPKGFTVGALLRQLLHTPVDNNDPIYEGGPVEGPVVILHDSPTGDDHLIVPGISLATDEDEFTRVCQQSSIRYRVFNGYSGWAPGQLEEELKQGGWLLWKLDKEDIFAGNDELWQHAVRQIGREIITDSTQIAHLPSDPSLN